MLQNGATGVRPLNLPFVNNAPGLPPVNPYEIIRRPPNAEIPISPTGSSRLYNQAQIRILLDDVQANLPQGPQPGDRQLGFYPNYPAVPPPALPPPAGATGPGLTPMAQGAQLQPVNGAGKCIDPAIPPPRSNVVPCVGWDTAWVNRVPPALPAVGTAWPLISGWLRVEYRDNNGNWNNITQEWLNLGFARQAQQGGPTPNLDATPVQITNTVHPNAILLFQYPSDPARYTPAAPQYGWYPINMYDPREGETRDNNPALPFVGGPSCAVGGVMNVIELDMDNLRRWINGAIGVSGPAVNNTAQNGYVVYFSDRRGMQFDPLSPIVPPELNGEYGFTDVVNIAAVDGAPNGGLDLGEDVNGDGRLRNYGTATIATGFGLPAVVNTNPYTGPARINNCDPVARVNQVTGPRHVLRVVNGGLGHVPVILGAPPNNPGGTTIASENPVYVLGNYNFNANAFANPAIPGPNGVPEAASAVIADAVTLLSNSYTDLRGLQNPTNLGGRPASTTYYRMAIAAGKNAMFPAPVNWVPTSNDFGTDGGVHNFLRYIEAWGQPNVSLNYQGSLVSFYFSRQAVGVFKCCNVVYSPPRRNYSFDQNFTNPARMPPGTPVFQDIDNLGYKQNFAKQ
jgi:hypothetical protein